jgi:hypothetical protein
LSFTTRGPWLVTTIVATWPAPGTASQQPALLSPSSKVMMIALLPFAQKPACVTSWTSSPV